MSTLADKRVLVTRALGQNAELVSKLESKQAIPLIYPCLEIAFLPFEIPVTQFDWIIFTSQNAAKAFKQVTLNPNIRIATVGPKTLPVTETTHPEHRFDSQSLAKMFEGLHSQKILLPQGDLADDFLKKALEQSGHEVTRLIVYSTRKPSHPVDFNFRELDAITFTSPSAAKYFLDLSKHNPSATIACIGTTTYQAAIDLGFKNILCAKEHSLDGLVQILEEHFA